MKKGVSIALALLLLISFLSFEGARTEKPESPQEGTYKFPEALLEIEDEAFFCTAVETVILPDGFQRMGDSAFAQANFLRAAYIPPTAEYISDFAFPENARFMIYGIEGSYAEHWAQKHRVPFEARDIWSAAAGRLRAFGAPGGAAHRTERAINPARAIQVNVRGADEGASMRPQERPELNRIDYRFP